MLMLVDNRWKLLSAEPAADLRTVFHILTTAGSSRTERGSHHWRPGTHHGEDEWLGGWTENLTGALTAGEYQRF